jgi:NADH-quinone oxidoreductase subunit L
MASAYLRFGRAGEALGPRRLALARVAEAGFGFDRAYDAMFVAPYVKISRALATDPPDFLYEAIGRFARRAYDVMRATQTGRLRLYAAALGIGTAVLIAIVVLA